MTKLVTWSKHDEREFTFSATISLPSPSSDLKVLNYVLTTASKYWGPKELVGKAREPCSPCGLGRSYRASGLVLFARGSLS